MAEYGIPPEGKFHEADVANFQQYNQTPIGDPVLFRSTRTYGDLWARRLEDSQWSPNNEWIPIHSTPVG